MIEQLKNPLQFPHLAHVLTKQTCYQHFHKSFELDVWYQYRCMHTEYGQYPAAYSCWSVPCCIPLMVCALLHTVYGLPLNAYSLWSVPCSILVTIYTLLDTVYGLYPAAHSLWSVPCSVLVMACTLLQTSYLLYPAAYCYGL